MKINTTKYDLVLFIVLTVGFGAISLISLSRLIYLSPSGLPVTHDSIFIIGIITGAMALACLICTGNIIHTLHKNGPRSVLEGRHIFVEFIGIDKVKEDMGGLVQYLRSTMGTTIDEHPSKGSIRCKIQRVNDQVPGFYHLQLIYTDGAWASRVSDIKVNPLCEHVSFNKTVALAIASFVRDINELLPSWA